MGGKRWEQRGVLLQAHMFVVYVSQQMKCFAAHYYYSISLARARQCVPAVRVGVRAVVVYVRSQVLSFRKLLVVVPRK